MSWLMEKYVRGVERLFIWLAPEVGWDDSDFDGLDWDEIDGEGGD